MAALNTPDVVVTDLDGTLCDDTHRKEWALKGNWDEYHSRLRLDPVIFPVARILFGMRQLGYKIVAATGRPERYRTATVEHLALNNCGGFIDEILMRRDDDRSPTPAAKLSMLMNWGTPQEALKRVLFILDDNERVVTAYRQAGFKVLQVGDGL